MGPSLAVQYTLTEVQGPNVGPPEVEFCIVTCRHSNWTSALQVASSPTQISKNFPLTHFLPMYSLKLKSRKNGKYAHLRICLSTSPDVLRAFRGEAKGYHRKVGHPQQDRFCGVISRSFNKVRIFKGTKSPPGPLEGGGGARDV